ncbi:HNH endonuclease [Pseudomonas gingeri]|nr:HNH endonuclease [Pseudomonas gingeri]NVZ77632.1 HNH endonuclease [Pseudomonas gingeri]
MKATINNVGLRLMMEDIAGLGTGELFTALQAIQGQIDYLENLPNAVSKTPGLRAVHRDYHERLVAGAQWATPPDVFDAQVQLALADPAEERERRLEAAEKKPRHVLRLVPDYDRNPDVVAHVLLRAQGICESCSKPAPFQRRSNGTPYLEVHHIVQLAHGGDDSVENAQALCPNCHRKTHFGVEA